VLVVTLYSFVPILSVLAFFSPSFSPQASLRAHTRAISASASSLHALTMYAQHPTAAIAPPQKPETFMLSNEAQQSLPQDAQVALQQVDNRAWKARNPLSAIARLLC
jgi:hypothetical protein